MPDSCPECGTPWTGEDNCTLRFHRYMALEMTSSDYAAVHHLTVAAYMLQHPSQLSLRGWLEERNLLKQFLVDGVSPEAVRTHRRPELDSGKRDWSLKKGPRLQLPPAFSWTLTILDVDDSSSARYRLDIESWARQVLQDASTIIA